MTRPPFAILKLPLLMLVAALLLAAGGILWGQRQAHNAEAALQQQRTALNQARQQLDRSRQQQRLLTTHLGDYQALVARGFVGTEDRLAWIEAVQLANRDAGLYGLSYRLMPRTASPSSLAQGLPLGQTRMTLTFPLLVETDLTRFLGALKTRVRGVPRSGVPPVAPGQYAIRSRQSPSSAGRMRSAVVHCGNDNGGPP